MAGFGPPLMMPLASLMSAVPSFGIDRLDRKALGLARDDVEFAGQADRSFALRDVLVRETRARHERRRADDLVHDVPAVELQDLDHLRIGRPRLRGIRHHDLALVLGLGEVRPRLRRLVERHHLRVDDEGLIVGREAVVLVVRSDGAARKRGILGRLVALEEIEVRVEIVGVGSDQHVAARVRLLRLEARQELAAAAADEIDLDAGILLLEFLDEGGHHLRAHRAVDDHRRRLRRRGARQGARRGDRGQRRPDSIADLHVRFPP